MNVSSCDSCSLKTGLSVSGDVYGPAGWVLEALTPSTILACKHVCRCRHMLLMVAESNPDCDRDLCDCLYLRKL